MRLKKNKKKTITIITIIIIIIIILITIMIIVEGEIYSLQALQDQTIEIEMTLAFYQKRQQLIIILILSLKSMIYSKGLIFKILMLILYFNRDLIT